MEKRKGERVTGRGPRKKESSASRGTDQEHVKKYFLAKKVWPCHLLPHGWKQGCYSE